MPERVLRKTALCGNSADVANCPWVQQKLGGPEPLPTFLGGANNAPGCFGVPHEITVPLTKKGEHAMIEVTVPAGECLEELLEVPVPDVKVFCTC